MLAKNTLGTQFKDGDVIIKQGEEGKELFVIQEGTVELLEEVGDKEVFITELGREEFFGEMALFEKDVRSCTIRAKGDVKVLSFDKRSFYKAIQKDPSLAFRLLEKMANRLRHMNQRLQ